MEKKKGKKTYFKQPCEDGVTIRNKLILVLASTLICEGGDNQTEGRERPAWCNKPEQLYQREHAKRHMLTESLSIRRLCTCTQATVWAEPRCGSVQKGTNSKELLSLEFSEATKMLSLTVYFI